MTDLEKEISALKEIAAYDSLPPLKKTVELIFSWSLERGDDGTYRAYRDFHVAKNLETARDSGHIANLYVIQLPDDYKYVINWKNHGIGMILDCPEDGLRADPIDISWENRQWFYNRVPSFCQEPHYF